MNDVNLEISTEYLSFQLAEELFAIEVSKVREVLEYTTVTRVPGSLDFMVGVINVRGSVVPVMDLKRKLNIPKSDPGINRRIVIMELTLNDEKVVVGFIADSVREVMSLSPFQIQAPPKLGSKLRIDYAKGILEQDDALIIILDIESIITGDNAVIMAMDNDRNSVTDSAPSS
jgi:purine-binding chemotaxis protein CheW